jgi:hypothetical protein
MRTAPPCPVSVLFFRAPLSCRGRQYGMAMAGFAVAAIPLLLVGLLVAESAHWHLTRQVLSLALLEAARAGATAHGRPDAIKTAFETALLPLYTPPGAHASARARMAAAFRHIARETRLPAWRIDIVQPSTRTFIDFADRAIQVPAAPGLAAIRNDYQAEQHDRRKSAGWREGRGPRSGLTIFQANTLQLRLTYLQTPWVPALRSLLRGLALLGWHGTPGAEAARAGRLAMVMDLSLTMQSHPVRWPNRVALPLQEM